MIKKAVIIKKILGEPLKEHGFEYAGSENGRWNFARTVNNIEHYFVICQSNFCKGIRLELYTSLRRMWTTQRMFCPYWMDKYGPIDFLEFEDEDSFKVILKEYADIAIKYGLEELERQSIPTREDLRQPTVDMQRDLYENQKKYYREFVDAHGLISYESGQSLDKIIELLKEKADKDYDDDMKAELIRIAAYYIEILIPLYTAELAFEDDFCIMKVKKGRRVARSLPLNEIHNAWNRIDDNPELLNKIFELDKRKFEYILNYK